MNRAQVDPCLLVKRKNGHLSGVIILQVGDILILGTETFLAEEEEAVARFKIKPRKPINEDETIFNGISIISNKNGEVLINQSDKIDKFDIPHDEKNFACQRSMAQYIGVNFRPDICAPVQLIAPGSQMTTTTEYATLSKVIKHLKGSKHECLRYTKVDMGTARMVVLTDASFGNSKGMKSQLGFVVLLVDEVLKYNLVH